MSPLGFTDLWRASWSAENQICQQLWSPGKCAPAFISSIKSNSSSMIIKHLKTEHCDEGIFLKLMPDVRDLVTNFKKVTPSLLVANMTTKRLINIKRPFLLFFFFWFFGSFFWLVGFLVFFFYCEDSSQQLW